MEYEERFGVKVDVRIPITVRAKLYEQWEGWKKGDVNSYTRLDKPNLMTRYEHFALGSVVGLPPDPFKPLALQHESADLEAVITARREVFPPGEKRKGFGYAFLIPNLQSLVGLEPEDCLLEAKDPDINAYGRVVIPRIVAVYHRNMRKLDLSNDVINQLQLPTSRDDLKLWEGVIAREVFDFEKGYRIEFVGIRSEEKEQVP